MRVMRSGSSLARPGGGSVLAILPALPPPDIPVDALPAAPGLHSASSALLLLLPGDQLWARRCHGPSHAETNRRAGPGDARSAGAVSPRGRRGDGRSRGFAGSASRGFDRIGGAPITARDSALRIISGCADRNL